jgi:uncharacterized protein YuzE
VHDNVGSDRLESVPDNAENGPMSKAIEQLESRVKRLEQELAEIKTALNKQAKTPWYEQIVGEFAADKVLESDMKVTYDPEVDVLRIVFRDALVEESDEDKPGVILDFDAVGAVIGIEILNASTRTDNPRSVDFAVLTAS